ncbi:MAG TPA: hypothetical protein VNV14_08200, partial [Opitutaceae bacterium]|nr:hypothetical protein [Opitutaceae bacterium]
MIRWIVLVLLLILILSKCTWGNLGFENDYDYENENDARGQNHVLRRPAECFNSLSMEPTKRRFKTSLLVMLGALAAVAAAAGYFILRGLDWSGLFNVAMGYVRAAGPLVF